ncbi:MAG: hypothetical protein ABII12_07210 [Planctomycetota bacterium]
MRISISPRNFARRSIALLLAVAVSSMVAQVALADEADDLAKQADKALRQAERLMHNGKATEAAQELDAVEKLLAKIEAAAPDQAKLKTLRSKAAKLRKDLERRQPKEKPKSGDAKPAKLPRAARESMEQFENAKRIIEHAYHWIENSKTTALSKPVEDYFKNIETRTEELAPALKEAKKLAADEGVSSHPDLDEAQCYLDAAPARLAAVRAELEQFNKDKAAKEAAELAAEEQAKADAAPDPNQAAQDWRELAILAKEYQDNFQSQSDFKKRGAMAAAAWKGWKKRFVPVRERFRECYGEHNPDIYTTFENVPKPDGVTMPATQASGIAYAIDLARCEQEFANWAADWGKDALRLSKSIKTDNKEKLELKYVRAEDAARYYKLAKLWKPGADHDAKILEAEAAAKEALPLWKEVLKELKWPGHNKSFAGPGEPEALAKAALEFLRENPEWSAPEYEDEHVPMAACVEGDAWSVWKRAPLTEQPTQYSVAILVAFSGQADPELVYVYHMVFYTAEAGGVKPGLPFRHTNSKQYAKFRMLKENVPAAKRR